MNIFTQLIYQQERVGELYPFILAGRPHSKPPWRIGLSVGVLHKPAKTPDEYDVNITGSFEIKK